MPINDESDKIKSLGHIPCLYLDSHVNSPILMIFFHGNGEDISLAYDFLNHIRNNLAINILAVEYPGYGLYKDKSSDSESIEEDALDVYDYVIN